MVAAVPDGSGDADLPGGRLHYRRRGVGPPVLLIAPSYLDARAWDPLVTTLEHGHELVTVDLRGHGDSSERGGPASDVDDLEGVAEHLGLGPMVLVGHADGAPIAAELAARRPERCRGLVLVAGVPRDVEMDATERRAWREALEEQGGTVLRLLETGNRADAAEAVLRLWAPRAREADRAWLRPIALDNLDPLAAALLDAGAAPDGEEPPAAPVLSRLAEAHLPVLAMVGAFDEPVLRARAHRISRALPTARVVELTQGDRTPTVSARPELEAFLREFLHRIEHQEPWPPASVRDAEGEAGLPASG